MRGYGAGVSDKIRSAGGQVFAITSEPQTLASQAQADWGSSMRHIGDPHQEVLEDCRTRDWLDLRVSNWDREMLKSHDHWIAHPKGFFQPGVLVVAKNGTILYRWQSSPTKENVGGATRRPTADYVWSRIDAALSSPQDRDAAFDRHPEVHDGSLPWPFVVALLLANGWFVRPKILAGATHTRSRQLAAVARIPLFVAVWWAAFSYLPVWISAGLLLGWLALITPGVRRMRRNFLGE